jgi:hypothetical protein
MDEDVFAILALDEAKTFARVKPPYRTCSFTIPHLLESLLSCLIG